MSTPGPDRAALRRRIIRLRLTIAAIVAVLVSVVAAIVISYVQTDDPQRCARIEDSQQSRAAEFFRSPEAASPTLPADLVELNQQLLDCQHR